MSRYRNSFKSWLVFFHRWLGVVFCVPFLLWFTSGIVLIYHAFPSVSEADRLNHAAPLKTSAIELTPQQAYDRLQQASGPESIRIVMIDGRPAYRFGFGRGESIVYADDGQVQDESRSDFARGLAAAWTGQSPTTARVEDLVERDQWTVSGEFKPLEPMRRFSWPDGEQVYVSTAVGEVVQYTTLASRTGAYFGAIPHWLYFTPLRKHTRFWSRLVIWLSGMAVVAALLGVIIGISVYAPEKVYAPGRVASAIPYIGAKRLHMILGLSFGVIASTWAFSGMLSMDPFPNLLGGDLDADSSQLSRALRQNPSSLAAFEVRTPKQALLSLPPDFHPKELELALVMSEPVYFAAAGPGQMLIIPVVGQSVTEFEHRSIIDDLEKAARPYKVTETRLVTQYETYYLDRHNLLPLPVIFMQFNDPQRSMYYVDPKTARIVAGYSSHSRLNRWLYHGLHSLDFPWLYRNGALWQAVMLTLLSGGIALSLTALILATRVVRRAFR